MKKSTTATTAKKKPKSEPATPKSKRKAGDPSASRIDLPGPDVHGLRELPKLQVDGYSLQLLSLIHISEPTRPY